MKCVILSAGGGLNNVPKCLLKLNGINILEYQIKSLLTYGINDVTIVVNKKNKEVIYDFCKANNIKVKFIVDSGAPHHSAFQSLKLFLRKPIDEELIILFGDTIWSKRAFEYVYKSKANICFVGSVMGVMKFSKSGIMRLKRYLRSKQFEEDKKIQTQTILLKRLNTITKEGFIVEDIDTTKRLQYIRRKFPNIKKPYEGKR